jgi:Tol biopolymer transport system component
VQFPYGFLMMRKLGHLVWGAVGVVLGCAGESAPADRLAFTSTRDGNTEIYTLELHDGVPGGAPRRLTSNTAEDDFPLFAPGGQKMSFLTNRDGNWELYVMNADGSNPRRLTNTPGFEHSPAWSPDGSTIAFATDRDGGDWEIYLMDADGGRPHNLTQAKGFDYSPTWSPDGRRIAFVSERDGNAELYVIDAAGGNLERLTTNDRHDSLSAAAWSPDGSHLVFQSNIDGSIEVCVLDFATHGIRQLTTHNAPAWNQPLDPMGQHLVNVTAVWSPDGGQLLFVSNRDGASDLFIMSADGQNPHNLTAPQRHPGDAYSNYSPHWAR